jgi:hypothetical protein
MNAAAERIYFLMETRRWLVRRALHLVGYDSAVAWTPLSILYCSKTRLPDDLFFLSAFDVCCVAMHGIH